MGLACRLMRDARQADGPRMVGPPDTPLDQFGLSCSGGLVFRVQDPVKTGILIKPRIYVGKECSGCLWSLPEIQLDLDITGGRLDDDMRFIGIGGSMAAGQRNGHPPDQ